MDKPKKQTNTPKYFVVPAPSMTDVKYMDEFCVTYENHFNNVCAFSDNEYHELVTCFRDEKHNELFFVYRIIKA